VAGVFFSLPLVTRSAAYLNPVGSDLRSQPYHADHLTVVLSSAHEIIGLVRVWCAKGPFFRAHGDSSWQLDELDLPSWVAGTWVFFVILFLKKECWLGKERRPKSYGMGETGTWLKRLRGARF
jgi:hypothetical protein